MLQVEQGANAERLMSIFTSYNNFEGLLEGCRSPLLKIQIDRIRIQFLKHFQTAERIFQKDGNNNSVDARNLIEFEILNGCRLARFARLIYLYDNVGKRYEAPPANPSRYAKEQPEIAALSKELYGVLNNIYIGAVPNRGAVTETIKAQQIILLVFDFLALIKDLQHNLYSDFQAVTDRSEKNLSLSHKEVSPVFFAYVIKGLLENLPDYCQDAVQPLINEVATILRRAEHDNYPMTSSDEGTCADQLLKLFKASPSSRFPSHQALSTAAGPAKEAPAPARSFLACCRVQ